MQAVNIGLTILGIGKGRSAISSKEDEVEGILVQFDGDPGAAFLSWKALKEQVTYKGTMQAQSNGSAHSNGPARAEAPRA